MSKHATETPIADAMHRKKVIYYHEEVNILPQLSSKLDSIVTATRRNNILGTANGNANAMNAKASMARMFANASSSTKGGGGGGGTTATATTAKATTGRVNYSFNPNSPLYYGASVSLESLPKPGKYLTVEWNTGKVLINETACAGRADILSFTLLDIRQLDSYRSIKYGDSVWLQVQPGNGELRWQNGSVLGTKVDHATVLPTVPLDPSEKCRDQNPYEGDNNASSGSVHSMGIATPIKASLPRSKEDKIDEKHARIRNHRAYSLGRWVIRPANEEMGRVGSPVLNSHQIYLEQDQTYICAGGQGTNDIILRQLPSISLAKDGATLAVDRHGVFRVCITEMDSVVEGMSEEEKKSALRMRKAKRNLRKSELVRKGQRVYPQHR